MTNEELADLAINWRQIAQTYRDCRNPLEVPNPPRSIARLEHLAQQIIDLLVDRDDTPTRAKSKRVTVAVETVG